jgi:MoaA/NifB/PqqE/SkfB family radical SAM enzyme/GT2 family glycosyltransferase
MKSVPYFFDERHVVLMDNGPSDIERGIGSDGSNVTIVMLSCDRAHLTIRLIRSVAEHVPHFKGKILIADNGSSAESLAQLAEFLTGCKLSVRLVEFGTNLGVARGRNRAFKEATTDWILSLDNDIYLTANPFPQLQRDLQLTGCQFLDVPLVNPDLQTFYSFGGILDSTLRGDRPALTIGQMPPMGQPLAFAQEFSPGGDPFLCSFLFGGASILNGSTFLDLGGFDEGVVVGFEDIDFSLRLFRKGMKIGCSTIACFVHDHPPPELDADLQYERARFSRRKLRDAASHLEKKHGFMFWEKGTDDWLRSKEVALDIPLSASSEPAASKAGNRLVGRKPRIALVTDTDDWAFANIAKQVTRHLGHRFEFVTIVMTRLAELEDARWRSRHPDRPPPDGGILALGQVLIQSGEFDILHFMWRDYLFFVDTWVLDHYAEFLGMTGAEFKKRFMDGACITTCVYDHLHLSPEVLAQKRKIFNEYSQAYYVSSERLRHIYQSLEDVKPPLQVIEDGVDLAMFYPQNLTRLDTAADRDIVIGWVGNSGWAASIGGDPKGVHTILKPAVEQLKAEGWHVTLRLADRSKRMIRHTDMHAYYATIDVLICTSAIEGTPNPILEAMACGVPVVSTDVGIVPQLFGPEQRKFILSERSVDALKAALIKLLDQPALLKTLSTENLHTIQAWDWRWQTKKFETFFDEVLRQRARVTGENRTKICTLPFHTPSMEVDGSIRLCSAASIFGFRDETNMGNCRTKGLAEVWSGEKYQAIRSSLFTGENLTPYCAGCEYRFDGPAWMLQLHVGLHAYHTGVRTPEIMQLLKQRLNRYDEYVREANAVGLQPLHLGAELESLPREPSRDSPVVVPEALIVGKDLPLYVDLNTLNRCNVSCVMCPPAIKFDKLGYKREEYYRLSVEEFSRLAAGVRLESAHFVGAYAEPLLNKDIFDLVKIAHDKGAFTAITTNAMPLSPVFAERLVNAGLDMMSISLHGATKEVAETIMRKSKFEKVVSNIRDLQSIKARHNTAKPEIFFNFVAQRQNVGDLPNFISLAADLGVKHVNVIHLIHYPELIREFVPEAARRGTELGVNVSISPAYQEVIDARPTPA